MLETCSHLCLHCRRYKDAQIRNEFHELSLEEDREGRFESLEDPNSEIVTEDQATLESEEVVSAGEIRQ